MEAEDIKTRAKLFAEAIRLGHTPEYFVMGISSGVDSEIYALTPQHMKRLHQYIEYELKLYEEKYGEIKAKWNPNVLSPLQRANKPQKGS